MKILIVGAGVIGASIAFHLARKGAEVTVIEAARPGQGASGRSFGWINASFFLNPAHHRLRVEAIAAYQRLQSQLPSLALWGQGALWWEEQGAAMDRFCEELADLRYPVERIAQSALADLEPALRRAPEQALRFPRESATDAAVLTRDLLAASGAKVLSGMAVKSLIAEAGQVRGLRSPIGPFLADHTVLAAGTATPDLLQSIGLDLPMLTRPGLLLRTAPVDIRLRHVLVMPGQEVRQSAEGALLAPCSANHQADSAEMTGDIDAARQATLARLNAAFDLHLTEAEVVRAQRPVPADGLPVLGQAMPGLSLAVMHSGVTLAPLAGEALAAEIMGQAIAPLWAEYRPERLLRRI